MAWVILVHGVWYFKDKLLWFGSEDPLPSPLEAKALSLSPEVRALFLCLGLPQLFSIHSLHDHLFSWTVNGSLHPLHGLHKLQGDSLLYYSPYHCLQRDLNLDT